MDAERAFPYTPGVADPIAELKRLVAWHEERHRPSGCGFLLADSIEFVDGAAWDAAAAEAGFFLSRPYLRALEAGAPSNLRPRYALVYDGKAPLAAVVMQVASISGDRVVEAGKRRAKPLSQVKATALVCGNLLTWGQHGVALAPGADPDKAWPGVAEALYRVRQAEKLAARTDLVLVKDTNPRTPGVRALERFSYRGVETEPDMVLTLDPAWRSFDDYLASLHSKYRKNAVKVGRDLAEAGCVVEPFTDWEREGAALHALYMKVHGAASLRPVTATAAYQAALARAAGPLLRCSVIRRGGEPLGFVTTVRESEEGAVGYHLGYDRAQRGELPLYFALLQAVVRDAIALGVRRVSFGRTALEPKAKLGARPVPTRIWVRHANPMANLLVDRLLTAVRHDEAPERSPFK